VIDRAGRRFLKRAGIVVGGISPCSTAAGLFAIRRVKSPRSLAKTYRNYAENALRATTRTARPGKTPFKAKKWLAKR
jgi:hypothetical protein